MKQQLALKKTADFVKSKLLGEGSGHDWWRVERVWKMAKFLASKEKVTIFSVELAALLHDIADWKFHDGDESIGPRIAGDWMKKLRIDDKAIKIVLEAIEDVSFKGAGVKRKIRSRVGAVVQDADRLDAMGAIGIARCFAYGGHKSREIHNPTIPHVLHQSTAAYKASVGPSINHFYEKLLLLKDLMNTKTAKAIASKRHACMEKFLEQFFMEWEAKG